MREVIKNFRWYFLVLLFVATFFVWYAVFYVEARAGRLTLDVLDVGQGDAVFVQADNGMQVLIDGGPDNSILSKLGEVMPFWDRSIDLVILTHPHADHLDGLVEVLRRYSIDTVLETGVNHSIPEYSEWHQLLKDKNIKVVLAKTGQRIKLSDSAYLDILTPFEDFTDKSSKNIHDAMIVSKLTYGSTTALLMGDAERSLEYQLLFSGMNLKSDILKVGHHGSKTSTSDEFLQAVLPRFAIISVGKKNRYGHPYQEVMDILEKFGVKTLRTDLVGSVIIKSDRENIVFE
jgi:competence protein ComEC